MNPPAVLERLLVVRVSRTITGDHMRTRRAALALVGTLLALAPDAHAGTLQYAYVANASGAYSDLDEMLLPAEAAVLGQLRFVPRTSRVTIRIDDRSVLDGQTVAVAVWGGRGGWRCLRVRTVETIRGLVPGKTSGISILGDGAWLPDPGPGCTGHASAGTAEIGL